MNRGRSSSGYTIVETMVFLAVSGALFLTAVLLVNGQQRKTEFTTAVRDFDSKLQSVIGNVTSGYYHGGGSITCEDQPGPLLKITSSPSPQGQNSDCTFIGQWIELAPSNDNFTITSYAGVRRDSSGKEVQTLADAKPTPISATAETFKLLSGVTASMKRISPSTPFTTLAIITTFNQYSGGSLSSGSSRSDIHAINGVTTIGINPSGGVQICLTDQEQYGAILLNTGSTVVTIGKGNTCP